MVFSSYLFLFYFLPAALLLYYLVPRRLKQGLLTIVSYVFEKGEVCLQGNAKDPIENEHIKTTYLDYDD